MKTKRPRLSITNNSVTNPHPDHKQEELPNTHEPKITKKSKKTITATAASCTINFPSRKIRNLSVQHKEEAIILDRPTTELKTLSSEDDVVMAIKHLKECDLKLSSVIEMHDTPKFEKCQSAFQSLVRSIVYQQLATKAAASIHNRLVSLCEGENSVIPETISKLSAAEMRKIGISERKASYIHDLASNFMSGVLSDSLIFEMDDASLISSLTAVKGIGVWSVHMFMIFALHRPDVLPVGDLGVRKGFQKLYGLKDLPTPAQMEDLSNSWRPYRSIGSWYMWRIIGTKSPIVSS
ncbi:hypothetical protein SUGI_0367290 [Cryptomeria japonica]|uniref:alkylbase DNA glycosidase-like protein mag2 n=1 Tax=Cryptomeria japonica TaxID=3369 RepID=UPI002408C42E|nr:alkylbase DNA glycosidase-like protein mag2 [Cryptomeria japonica]GLJ20236.1 hypothetical protein SUGI_0367290 [Cryptomeria japonica]